MITRTEYLRGDPRTCALHVEDTGVAVTYGALRAIVDRLARELAVHGVRAGGRVALFLPGGVAFASALIAAMRAGASVLPLDLTSRGAHLSECLAAASPAAVITSPSLATRLAGSLPAGTRVLVQEIDPGCPERCGIEGLGTDGANGHALHAVPEAPVHDSADALLVATSGTTGTPKIVRLGHRALQQNISAHLDSLGLAFPFVSLQVLPLNYSYGLVASFLGTLWAGGTVVLPRGTDRAAIMAALRESAAQVVFGTPALFRLLVERADEGDRQALSQLQLVGIGGDRCPVHLRRELAATFRSARCCATYGLTECGPRVTTLPHAAFLERGESVGLPLRGVELDVRRPAGGRCRPGEIGDLHVRTPSLMSGYLGDGAHASSVTADGWFTTGDLASVDEDGYLFVHGRSDRVVKFRGRRFNPAVVERCLEAHPRVVAAQVCIGAGRAPERLQAIVRVRPGFEPALEQALVALCRRNLPNAFVPNELTLVADEGVFFKGKQLCP
jgi:feruloyl-CoA synthase